MDLRNKNEAKAFNAGYKRAVKDNSINLALESDVKWNLKRSARKQLTYEEQIERHSKNAQFWYNECHKEQNKVQELRDEIARLNSIIYSQKREIDMLNKDCIYYYEQLNPCNNMDEYYAESYESEDDE